MATPIAAARMPALSPEELELYRLDPRQAVKERHIVCLTCGAAFRQITNTHIRSHDMTSEEYKRIHGYNLRRPLMCHELRRRYAERAVQTRLADRIRRRPIVDNAELRRQGGARKVSFEEQLTRRDVQRQPRERWNVRDEQGRFFSSDVYANAGQISGRA